MPEKLAFHEGGWYRGAVNRNQGFVGATAGAVNRPSDQFFAGAGFAKNQDRGIADRDLLDILQDRFECGALPNYLLKAAKFVERFTQIFGFGGEKINFRSASSRSLMFLKISV
jgi:hypothetical protein